MSESVLSDRASWRIFSCGLLVIVGLGAAARFWQANESLWLDELHTSWVVSGTFDEIAPRARIGNQSPLYFYLVRMVTIALGNDELALRLPSLAAGISLIAVAGIVTWRWSGAVWAGWLAAALVAIDHNMIFFSQEARPYALVQLVALLQLAAFWRLQTAYHWRDRWAVSGGWILLFYLHYTAIVLAAGELFWWAVIQHWQRGRGGYRLTQVLCDVGLTGLACAVAGAHLAEIAARRSMWQMFIFQKPPWVALRWFHCNLYVLSALLWCVGLMAAAYLWPRRRSESQVGIPVSRWVAVVPLLVCWWSAPVLLAWALTASDVARVFFPRYLIGVAVAPMICAGLCLTVCRGPRSRALAASAVVVLAIYGNGLWSQYHRDGRLITDRRQDWRGAVSWLNTERRDALPVLVRSGLVEADRLRTDASEQLREYCLLPVTSLYPITSTGTPTGAVEPLPTSHTGRLTRQLQLLLQQHQGAWLVISAPPRTHAAIRQDLRASLPGRELTFVREKSFGNVAVWQVQSDVVQSSHLAPPR